MVSWKSSLAFLAFYTVYLLMGSYMIYNTECPDKLVVRSRRATRKREFTALMSVLFSRTEELRLKMSPHNLTSILNHELPELISLSKVLAHEGAVADNDCKTWSFFNSFFVAFTSITTIGFGTVAPETQLGRGTCLIYSIVGLPINSILIGFIGNSFINKVCQ